MVLALAGRDRADIDAGDGATAVQQVPAQTELGGGGALVAGEAILTPGHAELALEGQAARDPVLDEGGGGLVPARLYGGGGAVGVEGVVGGLPLVADDDLAFALGHGPGAGLSLGCGGRREQDACRDGNPHASSAP